MERPLPHGDERLNIEQYPKAAFIALGSNMGDRQAMLEQALYKLDTCEGVTVRCLSPIYETDPVGYTDQPAFLNMVARLDTTCAPLELLHIMQDIEKELGRVRLERWGPRTIDLDLLHYEGVVMDSEELTVPHPRMMERGFVLVPLGDCLADYVAEPQLRRKVEQAAYEAQRDRKEGITLWNTINWLNG
ncbi:2-amino-4-hydroxy-6-hydroxymethyldihydropteridine diphosphokinase [Paenibacillus sp. SYP-B4298]|uniref:2-amino-4-hydroxy-6- hydroxymethyldihydropteridine diphosphokinase n=1 Tax=Paenibacillus sp. SYP-B4298 TaxID=2996034 RepID=UPI0022DD7DA3|nr:2-amino-4-hydroxy-6-hydroxymethyldihydropteridine diphosphokinase [Paenibacillus sp. SYP-B4298]